MKIKAWNEDGKTLTDEYLEKRLNMNIAIQKAAVKAYQSAIAVSSVNEDALMVATEAAEALTLALWQYGELEGNKVLELSKISFVPAHESKI